MIPLIALFSFPRLDSVRVAVGHAGLGVFSVTMRKVIKMVNIVRVLGNGNVEERFAWLLGHARARRRHLVVHDRPGLPARRSRVWELLFGFGWSELLKYVAPSEFVCWSVPSQAAPKVALWESLISGLTHQRQALEAKYMTMFRQMFDRQQTRCVAFCVVGRSSVSSLGNASSSAFKAVVCPAVRQRRHPRQGWQDAAGGPVSGLDGRTAS